jgi:trk system potassium uptake protein TrkA
MYLIVVGAEPEGIHLIDFAVQDGHRVSLIEADEDKARTVLKEHDIQVFHGEISHEAILDEADAGDADAIAATTPDDAINLMAMMLGRQYGVKNLISIVRQTHHRSLFENLGVQILTNPAEIVAKQLYNLVQPDSKEA